MGQVRENFICFVSLGVAEIFGFSELSIYAEVVLLKTLYSNLNYTSTANIEEVMKFYSVGNKTFETDFRNAANICDEDEPKAENRKKREKPTVLFLGRDTNHLSLPQ